ncbi:MAG TPA: tagatose-6-phosphate ketose isomerase, partial [Bacteroidales bacterium]|nr:tagatose-6-phosphate ketose isomerase [Bacteroidales bacterium]
VVTIPTTHIVSHPGDYFEADTPTLLISFARSGNSPESVASVALAEKYCSKCHHLIITCNADGHLANYPLKDESYIFILPPEADDKSLAMTGSYSGMMLASLLINDIANIYDNKKIVDTLTGYGNHILSNYSRLIRKIAQKSFKRAVFLGSGPMYGTAMESQLKLQELTDGQVICKNDSYLGFRHGPKAVVDETTLVVYFFSNVSTVLRYEKDLLNDMIKGKPSLCQIGISESKIDGISMDYELIMPDLGTTINEEYLPVCYILVGQMFGFYKSLSLGLHPDSPSDSGAISRVVEGVIIYGED